MNKSVNKKTPKSQNKSLNKQKSNPRNKIKSNVKGQKNERRDNSKRNPSKSKSKEKFGKGRSSNTNEEDNINSNSLFEKSKINGMSSDQQLELLKELHSKIVLAPEENVIVENNTDQTFINDVLSHQNTEFEGSFNCLASPR